VTCTEAHRVSPPLLLQLLLLLHLAWRTLAGRSTWQPAQVEGSRQDLGEGKKAATIEATGPPRATFPEHYLIIRRTFQLGAC